MNPPTNHKAHHLWARIARITIALAIMRAGRTLYALADWILPDDFRLGREDRGGSEN